MASCCGSGVQCDSKLLPSSCSHLIPQPLMKGNPPRRATGDSAAAPHHCNALGPQSLTLTTPLSLGLPSNLGCRLQPKDVRAMITGHSQPQVDVLSNSHRRQKDLSGEILFYSPCPLVCLLFLRSGFTSRSTLPKPSPDQAGWL